MPDFRMILRFFVALFILGILSSLLFSQQIHFVQLQPEDIPGDTAVERIIVSLVNQERAKQNLSSVMPDESLRLAARRHAWDMHKKNYFSHIAPVRRFKEPVDRVYQAGLTDYAVGENIALHSLEGDERNIAEKFMEQWMNSPGHRANILKPEFNTIGIGVIRHRDTVLTDTLIRGRRQKAMWIKIKNYAVQLFSDRDFIFRSLFLENRTEKTFHLRLRFDTERDIILRTEPQKTVDGFFQKSEISGNKQKFNPSETKIYYSIPKSKRQYFDVQGIYTQPLKMKFLLFVNPAEKIYQSFLRADFDENHIESFYSVLRTSPILLQKPKIWIGESALWVLYGELQYVSGRNQPFVVVRLGDKEETRRSSDESGIYFAVPVWISSDELTVYFGCGDERQSVFRHRIKINTTKLKRLKKDGQIDEQKRHELFCQ